MKEKRVGDSTSSRLSTSTSHPPRSAGRNAYPTFSSRVSIYLTLMPIRDPTSTMPRERVSSQVMRIPPDSGKDSQTRRIKSSPQSRCPALSRSKRRRLGLSRPTTVLPVDPNPSSPRLHSRVHPLPRPTKELTTGHLTPQLRMPFSRRTPILLDQTPCMTLHLTKPGVQVAKHPLDGHQPEPPAYLDRVRPRVLISLTCFCLSASPFSC